MLQVASVFSNHMVLQRDKMIAIFGKATDHIRVSCAIKGFPKRSTMAANGKFVLHLPPMKAGGPYELTIESEGQEVTFSDVYIGEVFIAGGQSNMEFELGNCMEGEEELKQESFPLIRFYYTQKKSILDDEFYASERNTSWAVAGDEWMKAWSAVGYFFAKKLQTTLGVPVGIIGCNWGGTSASAWMDSESLIEDEELRSYVDEYEKAIEGKSIAEQIKEYDDYVIYHAKWEAEVAKLYEKDPAMSWNKAQEILGPCQWPGPMNCKNPYRPSGLYECMLQRIMPYTVNGVIWYQGESDDHKPRMYEKLFMKMIQRWRVYFDNPELYFLVVQLPMNRYETDPDYKHWPYIREAQERVCGNAANAFMTVISDYSQLNDIHPKYKKPVGDRLADLATRHIYHINSEICVDPPKVEFVDFHDGVADIYFVNAEDGFEVREPFCASLRTVQYDPDVVRGFELASYDRVYYEAVVDEMANNRIRIHSDPVLEPVYVRFAWTNYMDVNLFARNSGLPVPTFRSSMRDERKEDEELGKAQIQQIMEV